MKIPLSWLNEYVEISDLTVDELSEKLTFSGIEVESVTACGVVLDENFVVGEILSCVVHPDSDHLHVCEVSDGSGTPLQIVCGAPNCRAGLKTALAKTGALIPEGGFRIKPAKLRGVQSCGMLCSARELGVGDGNAGIMELAQDAVAGMPLASLFPPPETVMDLEITWNRPDCLSIIGIAREFSAILGRPLKMPSTDFEESGPPVESLAKVVVTSPENCPRYTARVLTGVTDGKSPDWMAKRLEECGVRSLGLVVDVTNYVMLECGQPLHAFDRSHLKEATVVVRQAMEGEKIKTLDEIDRKLSSDMLVIADAQTPVAIAGVMGGAESGIDRGAQSILLESALFAAPCIKNTATKLNIHSESSHRFERGVDPDLADWASRRAVSLLAKYGHGEVATGLIDIDNRKREAAVVRLDYRRARNLIGLDLEAGTMTEILKSLGLRLVASDLSGADFEIPSWRLDLECSADLVEEIARMHGLDKLPDSSPSAIVTPADDRPFRAEVACREAVAAMGFAEGMHYSFLSAAELNAFNPDASHRLVLPNPVSGDYGVMRDSLLPQLVASLGRNWARRVPAPALFEIGRVFARDEAGSIEEEKRVSLGFCGPFGRHGLDRRREVSGEEAIFWLKGVLENLCRTLRAPAPRFALEDFAPFEKGWSTLIRLGKNVAGRLGLVKPALRHPYRVNVPMAVAELRLEPLLENFGSLRALKPVAEFPGTSRDIAIVAPPGLTNGEIEQAIRKAAPKTLVAINLFDVFQPEKSPTASRSLGYSLEFASPERTLTDEEVNIAFRKIIDSVTKALGVEIRAG